jgi:hypothetical protein
MRYRRTPSAPSRQNWKICARSGRYSRNQSHPMFVAAAETDVFYPPDVVKPAFETIAVAAG